MAPLEVVRLREDLEAFQGALMLEFYSNYAGLKDDMSTTGIYDRYAHLFSKDTLAALAGPPPDDDPDEARRRRYLRAFCTVGHLDSAVKELTDKANTYEARSVVEFDGETIPYRSVPVRLRSEPGHARREQLFHAKLGVTEGLNEVLLERMGGAHELAGALGFRNYRDMCSTLKGVDYAALEEQMEDFLHRTGGLYREHMDALLTDRAGVELEDAWSFDVPFALRGDDFDQYFAKDRLVPVFHGTLKGMGIEPERYTNIEVDTEARPKKVPRAFCAPIRVPGDVKLVILPMGGWKDYGAFFHEGGHAWHFGSTNESLAPEYRYLGDNSVTEAFAFLFTYLPSNPAWLKRFVGMEDPGEYTRFALVDKLMFLRRYASKLIYETKLHTGTPGPEFQHIYKNCLQKGLGFKHSEKHYLEDVDDGFYCAEYLRAWILEGQLREALMEKFGDEWFADPRAGEYLRELWSYGQKYTADELVKTIGYVELDPEPMIREIEQGLGDSG